MMVGGKIAGESILVVSLRANALEAQVLKQHTEL